MAEGISYNLMNNVGEVVPYVPLDVQRASCA